MQIKHILAAAALVATGAANAAIDKGAAGNGSLFMIGFDNQGGTTTAGLFDLGFSLDDFVSAAATGANTALGTNGVDGTTIVWNFKTNTVTVNGALASIGSNSWTAAYNTLIANSDAGELQYVVGAHDTTGFGAGQRALISGSTTATLSLQTGSSTTNLGQIVSTNDIFTPIANKGTIGSVDNGAYTFTAADGATTRSNGYMVAGDGFANNWRNNNKLGGTVYAGEVNGLWFADGLGNERMLGGDKVGASLRQSTVLFNAAAGTLTFATAAVPEPSTYAMALLGLAVAGVAARRRRA